MAGAVGLQAHAGSQAEAYAKPPKQQQKALGVGWTWEEREAGVGCVVSGFPLALMCPMWCPGNGSSTQEVLPSGELSEHLLGSRSSSFTVQCYGQLCAGYFVTFRTTWGKLIPINLSKTHSHVWKFTRYGIFAGMVQRDLALGFIWFTILIGDQEELKSRTCFAMWHLKIILNSFQNSLRKKRGLWVWLNIKMKTQCRK